MIRKLIKLGVGVICLSLVTLTMTSCGETEEQKELALRISEYKELKSQADDNMDAMKEIFESYCFGLCYNINEVDKAYEEYKKDYAVKAIKNFDINNLDTNLSLRKISEIETQIDIINGFILGWATESCSKGNMCSSRKNFEGKSEYQINQINDYGDPARAKDNEIGVIIVKYLFNDEFSTSGHKQSYLCEGKQYTSNYDHSCPTFIEPDKRVEQCNVYSDLISTTDLINLIGGYKKEGVGYKLYKSPKEYTWVEFRDLLKSLEPAKECMKNAWSD